MSAYFKLGSLFKGIVTTATAAGTTTLINSSKQYQQFTGTTTQTVVLPDATTLSSSRRFDVLNRSTGAVTVNANGGGLLATIAANSQQYFLLTNNGSSAGTWAVGGVNSGGSGATVSSADKLNLLGGMAAINASTDNIESRLLKLNPEEIGGDYWTTKASLPGTAVQYAPNFSLNGYLYQTGGNPSGTTTNATVRYDQDNNYWLARSNLLASEYGMGAWTDSSAGYVAGGSTSTSSGALATAYKYVDTTDTWSAITSLSVARMYLESAFYSGTYGYITSGTTDVTTITLVADTEAYSSALNTWYVKLAAGADTNVRYASATYYNGYGYIISGGNGTSSGGPQGGGEFQTVRKYNEASNSYSINPGSVVNGRSGANSYVAAGFINMHSGIGGSGTNTYYSSSEQFSDATGIWQLKSSSAGSHTNSYGNPVVNGFGYAVGGYDGSARTLVVEQHTHASMFNLGSLKRSTVAPTSILVAVSTNTLTNNLPVQIRSDGDAWKTFLSGSDSILKLGETLSTKFQPYDKVMAADGTQTGSGSNASNSFDDGQNVWTVRANAPASTYLGQNFSVNGVGYLAGGLNGSIVATNYAYTDVTNTWVTKSSALPEARRNGNAFVIRGTAYIAGGFVGAAVVNTMRSYNSTTDVWTSMGTTSATVDNAASCGANDRGYVFGGTSTDASGGLTNSANSYDAILNAWTSLAVISSARGQMACAAIGGLPIIAGGWTPSASNLTQQYDPAANSYTTKTVVTSATEAPASGRQNGYLFVIGGYNGSAYTTNNYRFNPFSNSWDTRTAIGTVCGDFASSSFSANSYYNYEVRVGIPAFYAGAGSYSWKTLTSLPSFFAYGGSGLIGGQFLVAGGFSSGGIEQAISYAYSSDLNIWLSSTQLPLSKAVCGNFVLNDSLFMATGTTASNSGTQTTFQRDSATGVWSTRGNTNTLRSRLYSGCSLNGFGYLMGGSNVAGTTLIQTSEQYNMSTASWTLKASGSTTQRNYAGFFSSDGFYTIFGGVDNGTTRTNSVEQYNDVSNTYSSKTNHPQTSHGIGGFVIGGVPVTSGGYNGSSVWNVSTYTYSQALNAWLRIGDRPLSDGDCQVGSEGYMAGGDVNGISSYKLTSSVKNALQGIALEVK